MMNRSCVVALCAAFAFVAAPAYAGITISLKPARTSGVSPLYVFFDATGTTSTDVSDPFGNLLYQWNFGDANPVSGGAAAWNVSGKLKNTATGPLAAHVYECAGPSNCTETVTLTVRAPDGVVNSATTTITVYPASHIDGSTPGSKTVCVSSSGDFTGCPNGASRVVSSAEFTSILSSQINGNGMRRVLFRRGDSWNATGNFTLTANGPGLIGAYGSGKAPFVKATNSLNNNGLFVCYGNDANGVGSGADWRIMDLSSEGGPGGNTYNNGFFLNSTGGRACQQLLVYRVSITADANDQYSYAFLMNDWHFPSQAVSSMHNEVAVVDSTVSASWAYDGYWGARQTAFLGDDFGPVTDEHVLRIPCARGIVIADTYLHGASLQKSELKLHAGEPTCPKIAGVATSANIDISDSRFGSTASQWSVGLSGNQNNYTSTELVRDVLFERNLVEVQDSNGTSQAGVLINTTHGIYRNNIVIGTGGLANHYKGFYPVQTATAFGPDNNQIYNNTCYKADAGSIFCVDGYDGGSTDTYVRDNLLYKPNPTEAGGKTSAAVRSGGSNFVADHNVTIRTASSDPFVSPLPSSDSDFRLHAAPNPAIGAGVAGPVLLDFGLRLRGATRDVGAWADDPSGATPPSAPVLLQ